MSFNEGDLLFRQAVIGKLDLIGNLLYAINLKIECRTCISLKSECPLCGLQRKRIQRKRVYWDQIEDQEDTNE